MTKKEIQFLYDYDKWADLRLLEPIVKLTNEQFTKDLNTSFRGVHGTLIHIISANRVWLDRWNGNKPEPLKPENFPTVETIKKQMDIYHCNIENFLQKITEEKLSNPLNYQDFKGNNYSHPLYIQMQHKVNHSTYHRGQLVTMLRQLNASTINTDIICYVRERENG